MAGDWIKMRTSLLTNPKVNGIARILEESRDVAAALSTGYSGTMHEIVTRNVMRHVTVSSLLVIWGAANEHTRDGIFANADLSDIDDMVGIPGFAEAMVSVGWLQHDADTNTLTLPNFNEYNTSGSERSAGAKTAAQRQKEYRDRKKALESDVTSDVTSNRREEKRREEKKDKPPKAPKGAECLGFSEFWNEYPNHAAKANAMKAWGSVPVELHSAVMTAVKAQKRSPAWIKDAGQFVPHAATWLRGKRWEDTVAQAQNADTSWLAATGFETLAEAQNARCHIGNAHEFRNRQRVEVHA